MRVGIVVPMTTEARTLFEMREFPVRRRLGIWEVHEHQEGDKILGLMVGGIGMVNAAMSTQALISGWEPDIVALVGCAGGLVEDLLPGDVLIGKTLCCYSSYSTAADGSINPDILGLRVGTDYTLSEDRSDFATDSRTKQRYIHSTPWLVEAAVAAGEECRDAFHVWPTDIVRQLTTSKFGQRAPRCTAGVIGTADQIHSDLNVIAKMREIWGMDAEECEGVAVGQVALSHQKPFIVIRGISDNEVVDPFLGEFLRSNKSGLDSVEIESTRNAWLVFLTMLKKL